MHVYRLSSRPKGYKVFDLDSERVLVSQDALYYEDVFPCQSENPQSIRVLAENSHLSPTFPNMNP